MKKRPERLRWLAICLFAVAVSFPLQVAWMFEEPLSQMGLIASQLAPLNWVVMVLAIATGWFALKASPILLAAMPALSLVVIYNNWLVAQTGLNASPETAALGAGSLLVFFAYCLNTQVLNLLLHPTQRWWMTPARYPLSLSLHLDGRPAQTFDLSATGAFIPQVNLVAGTRVKLDLPIGPGKSPLALEAQVVRRTEASGRYPGGVGIRFEAMTRAQKTLIEEFLNRPPSPALAGSGALMH